MQSLIMLLGLTVFLSQCNEDRSSNQQDSAKTKSISAKPDRKTEEGSTDSAIEKTSDVVAQDTTVADPAIPAPREPCQKPAQLPAESYTIEYAVKLINSLPMPVTIPCVVDVLPHPLSINVTSSDLSVQPANGANNPRIFIKIDSLIMTFAVSGEGAKTIEFSQSIATDRSVKGELAFPVSKALALTSAYDQVVSSQGTGTKCAGCHFDEAAASSQFPSPAFASRALRPFERQAVSISDLKILTENCTDAESIRCQLFESIFRGGDPKQFDFSPSMPTLF
jgi:hypothetical protein